MRIKLVDPHQEAEFIRRARTETTKNIGEAPSAAAVEPSPFALYLVAFDDDEGGRPVGMAEIAFHDQVYASFAESPYPRSMNLDCFCPFQCMVGIRTIYVEAEYRQRAGSLYLQMIAAGGQVVTRLGARFATASTNANDAYLNRLYSKTCGKLMDTYAMEGATNDEIAVYIFDLNELLNQKLLARASASATFEIDHGLASSLRARSRWDEALRCA